MEKKKVIKHPLGEVFGFPIENESVRALRYRSQRLCPYNNRVPNCTKDKQKDPLGVCSVLHGNTAVITCPIRFREDWIMTTNAAKFIFPDPNTKWTALTEIRLNDANDLSAGNIDYVLVSYDSKGKIIDFGSLEVQGVYISGNLRDVFEAYMEKPSKKFSWSTSYNYPKPDYLSSSRKRLIPQMLFKGGIFKTWQKKQTVALQKSFFETLPKLPVVRSEKADIAWYLYDLVLDDKSKQYKMSLVETVYTEFEPALHRVITPQPGNVNKFVNLLQTKLNDKLTPPDAPTLMDVITPE